MQYDNKTTRKVAEAAAKIMANEAKKGTEPESEKEKNLAALAHPKDKITHKDVLVGRGVLKKEETEQIDELSTQTLSSYIKKRGLQLRGGASDKGKIKGINMAMKKIDRKISEEPDSEQFAKEIEMQKEKNSGKVRNDAGIAKPFQSASVREPAVQPVRKEEAEQIDELSKNTLKSYVDKAATRLVAGDKYKGMDRYNRVEGIKKATSKLAKEESEQIEERSLTEPEMKKKEEYVKGMKKRLSGFKERYGSRGKSVMYATATKMAKED